MAYKALYRTYRPQKFSEVIGQDHIVRTLQNSILNGKTSHAYLFSGPRGTGKTSVARIFAKALNCAESEENEPCGKCVSCLEITESNSPDVVEIDAASNNGVDEIRDIRDKVKFLPTGSKYKIYIIDEVHMLSQGAFNALLKTLEEPPKHVIFILATTEPHKVIPTIISRCQRFDFKALSVKEIAKLIKQVAGEEGFSITEEAIIAIAEGAEGGMRDALGYLDQAASFTDEEINIDDVNSVTGSLNYDKIIELAIYFEEKDINQALKTISDLIIMGKEVNKVVSSLLQFYRDILLYKNIDTSMFSKYIYEKAEFKDLAKKTDAKKIFYYVDVLSDVQSKIKTSSTPGIYLDVAVIKMINEVGDNEAINRIEDLEERLANHKEPSSSDNEERLNLLENKFNKIKDELNKFDLPSLVKELDILKKESSKIQSMDLATFKEEIEALNSKGQAAPLAEGAVDYFLIEKKIIELEELVEQISKSLISKPKRIKRKSVNEGQLVFYNDEVIPYNEIKEAQEKNLEEETSDEDIGLIKLSDFEDNKKEISLEPAKAKTLRVEAGEEILESENSHLVRRINKIPDAIEERPIIPEKQIVEVEEEIDSEIDSEIDFATYLNDEEYNSFSVSVLERILHSSRTSDAREDKVRIINLWKSLTKNSSSDDLRIAQLLQDGQIVAVGEKEFVIVYSSVSLCNQVMKLKFKRRSLQVLYEIFGDIYNYMAIPERTWIEKRTEYINQYNIGIKYPKLTPIDDSNLNIGNEYDELTAHDKLLNEAFEVLGEGIVKIE